MNELLLLQFVLVFTVLCIPVESDTFPRGINRAIGSFYKPGPTFSCLDGSQTIPYNQVNDDYCDCQDGTDEPGTAACPNGKFYCVNKGYKPENIPSSRVSDGVCDCCDGSDEYEGKTKCQNTCLEMGRFMREELAAMKMMVEEGHRIRVGYAQQGQEAKAEKQKLLVQLGPERDELQKRKDDLMAKKEEAEEPEKEAKEEFDVLQAEQKAKKDAEADRQRAEMAFKQIDGNSDQTITVEELQLLSEFDKDGDGTVSKEEATDTYMAGLESADLETFFSTVWPNVKEVYSPPTDTAQPIETPPTDDGEHDPEPRESDDDDDDADFDEDDFDEDDGDDNEDTSTDSNAVASYPEETQHLIKAADAARAAYNEVEQQYNEVEKQIKDIEAFMELDMGPDDVFYPLKSECFEYTDREYTYKFCPYEKATQRSKSGGSETNLGTFSRWEANGDDPYGFMKFEKGLHCWNGPDRSATVKLICGRENTLTNAAEPNRCEYSFDFSTPAACHMLLDAGSDGSHLHTEL